MPTSTKYRKRKMSATSPRRNSLIVSTAILLARSPNYSHAHNLRRSSEGGTKSKSSMVIVKDLGIEGEGVHGGSEVVGDPIYHSSTTSERSRSTMQEDEMELEDVVEPNEYIYDDSLVSVETEDSHQHRPQNQRLATSCLSTQLLWNVKFRTDSEPGEISWMLEQQSADNSWRTITSGPPIGTTYSKNTGYEGSVCLPGGKLYKMTMKGFTTGEGAYSYSVGGTVEFDSNFETSFTAERVHDFYVGYPDPVSFSARSDTCEGDEQQIGIRITTDKYGAENAWELQSEATNEVIRSAGLETYANGAPQTESVDVCVPPGKYVFTLTDGVGDGIGDGLYELYLDGELMVYGSDFRYGKKVQHTIIVGYDSQLTYRMSQREVQYLDCHNWRRKKYHEQFGASYVGVKYDLSLASDAQSYANELLDACEIDGILHEHGIEMGENLAKNMGESDTYGQLYPVENICRRWFEREETWPFPDNAHFTQGLWRSTRYLGCGEATKTMSNGGTCHVQVCRYARAGNCNMGQYQATVGDNWKIPMLMDHNPCGPACPLHGCH